MRKKIPVSFYRRNDVLQISRELLGKILLTNDGVHKTSGRIVELEAYAGITDRASHAFTGLRTKRNEVMYAPGGLAYVYLCYGIHHLFNVVTNEGGIPHAILIRALEPLDGLKIMAKRTGKAITDASITKGPGNLSKALGIDYSFNGISLTGKKICLTDDGNVPGHKEIYYSPRVGVDYAGKDALLPYRLSIRNNPFVSGKPV